MAESNANIEFVIPLACWFCGSPPWNFSCAWFSSFAFAFPPAKLDTSITKSDDPNADEVAEEMSELRLKFEQVESGGKSPAANVSIVCEMLPIWTENSPPAAVVIAFMRSSEPAQRKHGSNISISGDEMGGREK